MGIEKQNEVQHILLLFGIPISPGVASGPVKIVSDLSQTQKLFQGDILVLVPDDCGSDFVPAMKLAAAVISDRRGLGAPSAIVCRELRIPYVLCTEGASKIFKDGQVVTIDGSRGKVYAGKIEETPARAQDFAFGKWQVGDRIENRYEIHHIRGGPGKSGMGIVYLCYDHEFEEPVAIKTLQERFLSDRAVIQRFKWEAEAWVRLERHPNIVQEKYVGSYSEIEIMHGRTVDKPYIFLEYVVGDEQYGPDLTGWIWGRGLTLALTLNFAIQFCHGMIHADNKFKEMGKPFVHRDIKPSNVMITKNKVVKITDFGLVKAFAESGEDISSMAVDDGFHQRPGLSKSGGICGTPPYMSPEQCRGEKDIDARSDIYSFGCLLYEMVTGKYVFNARTPEEFIYHHLKTVPKSPNVQKELDRVIMKCLEKDPGRRFRNFNELERVFSELYHRLTGETVKPSEGILLEDPELSNKAISLHNLGRSEEAITSLLKARRAHPNYSEINASLASIYQDQGRIDDAIREYREALRLDPDHTAAHNNLGQAYENDGRFDEAIREYKEALRLDPDDTAVHYALGLAYKNQGKLDDAIDAYKEFLKLSINDHEIHVNLALVYEDDGRLDEAVREYKEALRLDQDDNAVHYARGCIYLKHGKNDNAILEFKEALRLSPNDALAHYNLGLAYEGQLKSTEAVACFREFIRLAGPEDTLLVRYVENEILRPIGRRLRQEL